MGIKNKKFPACASVARHLMAEAIDLLPGEYPPDDELIARAREIAASEPSSHESLLPQDRARAALDMLEEIGGL